MKIEQFETSGKFRLDGGDPVPVQPRQGDAQAHGGLDRTDAGHQRRDPGLEMRPVFGGRGHDIEDRDPAMPRQPHAVRS